MMVSPGLQEGHEHGLVGLRAGIRLDVGGFGAEQLLEAVDGQLLGDIDVLAAAVVALAGVAFGVLVGQLRALGFHDRGLVVFRRDQFDVVFLTLGAAVFGLDGGAQDDRRRLGEFEGIAGVVEQRLLQAGGVADAGRRAWLRYRR
jgi:hypothetical protein